MHQVLMFVLFAITAFAIVGIFRSVSGHAISSSTEIKSGLTGDCLDVYHDTKLAGSKVDAYGCNNTASQAWNVNNITIKHDNLCLSVINNGQSSGDNVDLEKCNNSPGEIWLTNENGLYNPNSQLCMTVPGNHLGVQLNMTSCKDTNKANEQWSSPMLTINCSGINTQGDRIACFAEKEWETWASPTSNHNGLLTTYTDGAPYEEWCADFVSYVYKEAGYPFAEGETNGWDESNANNVVNQGFTTYYPGSYIPKPGDVGYFDYDGGHVEIVISGGKQPTFIYGNSGTTDPATGNGEMAANTMTSDGSIGNIVYYMNPN